MSTLHRGCFLEPADTLHHPATGSPSSAGLPTLIGQQIVHRLAIAFGASAIDAFYGDRDRAFSILVTRFFLSDDPVFVTYITVKLNSRLTLLTKD